MDKAWIRRELHVAAAVRAGGLTLVSAAHHVRARVPGLPLGLSWQRPAAVFVKRADGGVREVPVRDVTRRLQVGVLAAAAVAGLVLWIAIGRD